MKMENNERYFIQETSNSIKTKIHQLIKLVDFCGTCLRFMY